MKIALYNLEPKINNPAMMQVSQYHKTKGDNIYIYKKLGRLPEWKQELRRIKIMGKEKYAPLSNIGASTYSTMPRITNDYYATSPQAITLLHKHHLLDKNTPYWECAVGGGI